MNLAKYSTGPHQKNNCVVNPLCEWRGDGLKLTWLIYALPRIAWVAGDILPLPGQFARFVKFYVAAACNISFTRFATIRSSPGTIIQLVMAMVSLSPMVSIDGCPSRRAWRASPALIFTFF